MIRFASAMVLFGFLAALVWFTVGSEPLAGLPSGMPPISMREVVLLIVALFAFKAWIHRRREQIEQGMDPPAD